MSMKSGGVWYDEEGNKFEMKYTIGKYIKDVSYIEYRKNGQVVHEDGRYTGNVTGDDDLSHQKNRFKTYAKDNGTSISGKNNVFASFDDLELFRVGYAFKQQHGGKSQDEWNTAHDTLTSQGFTGEQADDIILNPDAKSGYMEANKLRDDVQKYVDEGYDLADAEDIAGGADKNSFKTKGEKDQDRFESELKSGVSAAKTEAGDVADREAALATSNVAGALGESIKTQQSALISQGYTPEEAELMLSKGTEELGRVTAQIGEQSQILKGKQLGELSKFGITADMSAQGLAAKLGEIQQNAVQFQNKLKTTFDISKMGNATARFGQQLGFDASVYGSDRSYAATMGAARIGADAAMYAADNSGGGGSWWDSAVSSVGSAVGTYAAGKAIPYVASLFSDERLKDDVELKYKHPDGYHVYEFSYKGDDARYSGVMAQEIASIVPEAIMQDENGYYKVDYNKLAVDMEVVNG